MNGPNAFDGDELRVLRERAALFDLAAAYARNVDRRSYEAVEALFVPGGRLIRYDGPDISGEPASERRADGTLADLLRAGLERYAVTTHFLGQQTAEITGDEATVETYCLAHHVYEEAGEWMNRIMSIRYLDHCRRLDEGWRFQERCLVVDWTEIRPLGGGMISR